MTLTGHKLWEDDYRINASHSNGAFRGFKDCVITVDGSPIVTDQSDSDGDPDYVLATDLYTAGSGPDYDFTVKALTGYVNGLYFSTTARTHSSIWIAGDYCLYLVYSETADARPTAPAGSVDSYSFTTSFLPAAASAPANSFKLLTVTYSGGWTSPSYEDIIPGFYTDTNSAGRINGLDLSCYRNFYADAGVGTGDLGTEFDVDDYYVPVNHPATGWSLEGFPISSYVNVIGQATIQINQPQFFSNG